MRRLLAACAVLALAACITDTVTIPGRTATGGVGTTNGFAGTYTLTTAAGAPPPYIYMRSGADFNELLDDAMTLTDAGTWSELWHERHTVAGVAKLFTFNDAGTFTRSTGGDMIFVTPNHPTFNGLYNGSSLTLYGPSPTGQLVPEIFVK
jgi:hypothetical protein